MTQRGVKSPNAIDTYVGARVRTRRIIMQLSQENLGNALGITFQQVQKYEKGTNRIGASRLQQIAIILRVPVAYFFDGAPIVDASGIALPDASSPVCVSDLLATREGVALSKAFMDIPDDATRRRIVALVEEIYSAGKQKTTKDRSS